MKKLLIIIFFICTLCSCGNDLPTINQSSVITSNTVDIYDKYLHVNLPQFDMENQRLYYINWGKLTNSSWADTVYIFSDVQTEAAIQSKIYMIADVNGELLMYTIGMFDKVVIQNGELSLADINDDGRDEIIVHFEITGNGATITQIYKVDNHRIVLMADLTNFNTRFTSDFQNGYILRDRKSVV